MQLAKERPLRSMQGGRGRFAHRAAVVRDIRVEEAVEAAPVGRDVVGAVALVGPLPALRVGVRRAAAVGLA